MFGVALILLLGCPCRSFATPPTNAVVFNEPHLPDGLRQAQSFAGGSGFVASLPQLMRARVAADFHNEIWNNWYTTYSEESVVTSAGGRHMVVAVHGGGVLSSPARIDRVYAPDGSGMTSDGDGRGAAKLNQDEADGLLRGELPDGAKIPIYTFESFRRGINLLPERYGVTLDFEVAKNCTDGKRATCRVYGCAPGAYPCNARSVCCRFDYTSQLIAILLRLLVQDTQGSSTWQTTH